jgi:hypothetical protein
MQADEYDEFINAPFQFLLEKIIPRVNTNLGKDPISDALTLVSAFSASRTFQAEQMIMSSKIMAKHGLVQSFMTAPGFLAPFDFMSDRLRGFTGIMMDIRRIPDKVKAAVEMWKHYTLRLATPKVKRPGMICFIALHVAPYINQKAFEELYWPQLEYLVVELDKIGISCLLFAEHDWTNRAEFLARLPKSSIIYMEYGDPKIFTETVGKDHVFGGFYDPTISLARSKQECIDAAKRLLDITMKSGKYYFCFDKSVIDIRSIDIPKIQAVLEWVRDNAQY